MARILFCRFGDCLEAYVSQAGHLPTLCPYCGRIARWTTENPFERPSQQIHVDGNEAIGPSPSPFRLGPGDERFLRSLRILNDWPDQDDGA